MIGKTVSYPRRQQFRRLARADALGAGALLATLLGLLALRQCAGARCERELSRRYAMDDSWAALMRFQR